MEIHHNSNSNYIRFHGVVKLLLSNNNYIGMTRTDVTKTLFNKDKKVVIYFNSNYREFSKIADMRNCSELLKSDKWEIDFYKSNGKIFSYILHFKDNIVESQEISRRRDGP